MSADAAALSRLRDTQRVLVEALRSVLVASERAVGGCAVSRWAGYENGFGEEVGEQLDAAFLRVRAALASVEQPDSDHLTSAADEEVTARDAARYRWLRDNRSTRQAGDHMHPPLAQIDFARLSPGIVGDGPSIDEAVDAAMQEPKP